MRPENPEPTLPANRSWSPSYTPTASAPRSFALPSPGVQPPTTSSCSGRILIFSQAFERRPGSYVERRSFARIPSSPSRLAAAWNAIPSASTCDAKRTRFDSFSTLRSSRLRSSSGTLSSDRPSRYSRSNAW